LSIPAKLHFCWIGTHLPWAYIFAVLSAAENSDLPEIFLHHTDELEESAETNALCHDSRIRLRRLDAPARLLEAGSRLGIGRALQTLYARLEMPVARADVVRAAILYLEGGIYLDLDTVTVASLRPLLDVEQFLGSERIVWPQAARASHSPLLLARHLALDLLRKACKQLPQGWKSFRCLEEFYSLGVNNAVMGCVAGAALMAEYLLAMLELPPRRQAERYALGPHLLQDVLERHGKRDVVVHKPDVFYPLPPEISEHWFRPVRKPRPSQVLSGDTRVVHWYASVRTSRRVADVSPAYVIGNRGHQLYSALVCEHVHAIGALNADHPH
jgi:hypothetical protein